MATKRILVLGFCAAAGLAAAGVGTAVLRTAGSPSSRPDFSSGPSARSVVGRFASRPGSQERMVVVQRTTDGFICLWDSPDPLGAKGVGGCNPADDPLGGRKLFVNLTYDGGPDASTVHDARLSGLLTADVFVAEVRMSDGTSQRLPITRAATRALAGADYKVFAYRLRESDLSRGVTPVAVVALDANGKELDRQSTGIG